MSVFQHCQNDTTNINIPDTINYYRPIPIYDFHLQDLKPWKRAWHMNNINRKLIMWGGIGEEVEKQWLKASNIIYMI